MKKTLVGVIVYILLAAGAAWGQNAMQFHNLGNTSSLTYKKIDYYTKALEMNPKLTAAYEKRGMFYYFQENYDPMIQDFLRVTELQPFASEAYIWLGLAYMKKEEFDKALANLNRAIGLTPQSGIAYNYRAGTYRLKGMPAEAIRDATLAIDFGGPKNIMGMAYSTRAKAYKELGQSQRADVDSKIASKLDPEYYIFPHFSTVEFLANLTNEYSQLKHVSRMGAGMLIVLVLVVIFKLSFRPPSKRE